MVCPLVRSFGSAGASPSLAMHLQGENTFTAEFVMIVIATYAVREPFMRLGKTPTIDFEIDVKS